MIDGLGFAIAAGVKTNELTPLYADWPRLAQRLSTHAIRDAKDGEAVVFARVREPVRRNSNVLAVTAACLDIDGKESIPPPPAVATARLEALGLAAALWTTHSHRPTAPRYRIVAPLSEPMRPEALRWANAALAQALELEADPACNDAARAYYTASCPPAQRAHAYAWWTDGPALDKAPFEAEAEAFSRRQAAERLRRGTRSVRHNGQVLERAQQAIVSAGQGARNATLNRWGYIVGRAAAAGEVHASDAEQTLLQAAVTAGLDAHEAAYTVRRALRQGGAA